MTRDRHVSGLISGRRATRSSMREQLHPNKLSVDPRSWLKRAQRDGSSVSLTTIADTSIGNLQDVTRAWSRCPHCPRYTPHSILWCCGSSGATPLDVGIELPSSVTRPASAVCPSVVRGGANCATSPSGSSCRDIRSRRRLSCAES
jgi:hypothetical protein